MRRSPSRVSAGRPFSGDRPAPTPSQRAIHAQFVAEKVDAGSLRRFAEHSSSHSCVLVDERGERLVVGFRGSALQVPADWLPLDQISSAGALLADVRWPAGAQPALGAAREAGIPAILDAHVAPPETISMLAPWADHVVFSQRGLESYAGMDGVAGLRRILTQGARVAAVTQGEAGGLFIEAATPHEVRRCPAFPVHTVDTLAACDIFHGAYALALAQGYPAASAMRFAAAAAAIKCSRPGGRSGAPNRQKVDALLAQADASVGP